MALKGESNHKGEWHNIVWCCDAPWIIQLFFNSYVATESDVAQKTVDSVISQITWCLEKEPDKAFIAFDSGALNREKLEPSYKRGRTTKTAEYWGVYESLLTHIHNHFASDCPIVVSPGWEADDCIATIAKKAVSDGKKCVMMTIDKDCRQCLVAGKVNMQRRTKDPFGKPIWSFLTAADAEKDWECRVDQFVDYQILTGDEVDNIKGCRGIGSTRASMLLREYDSIEKMKLRATFPELPTEVERTLLKYLEKEEPVVRQLITLKNDCKLFNPVLETEVEA